MITVVSCGFIAANNLFTCYYVFLTSNLLTCLLVNLSTRQPDNLSLQKKIRERIEINLKQVISAPL